MSLLFNARRAKCIKIILPVVKHILANTNQRAIALPNSKPSLLTPIRYIWPNHKNAAKSIIFGFSLVGLMKLDETETNRQLIDTIKKGQLYFKNGDYNAFEQTLHEALKIANDLKNFDGVTHVYDLLANGAFMNKEYEKATDLFTKVVKRLIERGCLNDDIIILKLGFKISKIYEIQKKYKYSEYGYIYCLQHLEKKLKIDPENKEILSLYANTLDTYGRFLMNQGEMKLAKISFKKAYTVSVKVYGEFIEKNVILLNVLGTIYNSEGNFNRAIFYFRKAKKIGQHLPNMKSLAVVYINLGNVYLRQGMLNKAENNCVEALENSKRHRYFKGKKEAELCLAQINKVRKHRQKRVRK